MALRYFKIVLLSVLLLVSCGKDNVHIVPDIPGNETPDKPGPGTGGEHKTIYPDAASGIVVEPSVPDADGPCTIYFKPQPSNPLYSPTGDLYAHLGLSDPDDVSNWMFVPAKWDQNIDKCKFVDCGDHEWKLEIKPSIREFFGSGETPVQLLAIIVRSANGNTKSHNDDQFCSVTDQKFHQDEFVPGDVVKETMPAGAKYGINYNSDSSVTFVLYEKDKNGKSYNYCYIVGDWNEWKRRPEGAMKRDDAAGCWWITLDGFDPDTEYRFQYRLGSSTGVDVRVSDPYTRIVYDQWNDQYIPGVREFPSDAKGLVSAFQIKQDEYQWQVQDFKIEDKSNLIIYEMLLRDFTTTHDLAGALASLDYVENLGVNAIELMPVQEFDGNLSWGYNPNHYFALDKAYGTREQYKEFIDECHKRGIAVIFDVVYNHATGSHTWAKLYWDGANDRTADENPWFNAIAKHPFNVYHDFNHENPMVKNMVKESLAFLLEEYHIDGFRFDLTKGFTQNNTGEDVGKWSSYDASRIEILKSYADAIWTVNPDAAVIFEHLSNWDEEKVLADHGIQLWRNCNGEYRSTMSGSNADLGNMYSTSPFGGFVGYMESHDEERICYEVNAGASSVEWGICGTLTSWGSKPDITMSQDDVFFVAKNVTFTASDMFKIRGNNVWNDAYNYGASSKGYKLPLNDAYKLTLGASSQDMAVPADGSYDVYFCPQAATVWLMEVGKRPARPEIGSEDKLSVNLRKAGCNAAFCLLVPGPKMIWQFGEIGYDYSIEYNDRTGEKPIVTDEYMAVPARKKLYDTYAGLLQFRNDNPEFFKKEATFNWYVSTNEYPGKYIIGQANGKAFVVVGNFDNVTREIPATLPVAGTWYDYFDGGKTVETSGTSANFTLAAGEFKLLTNTK